MVDKVHPLKLEYPDEGGSETDLNPTGLNPNEDFVDVRGVTIQKDSGADEVVIISRDAEDNLNFKDGANTTPVTLSDLVAGTGGLTEDGHKILRQLIHFIDEGPAEGFTTGAYCETTGTVFPTAIVWYDSSGEGKKKIVEQLITWTGAVPTQIAWKIYDASETLLATVTDTITYSGVFETSRSRAIVES